MRLPLAKVASTRGIEMAVAASGFRELSMRFQHARGLEIRTMLHGDPIDRMLIAQAWSEQRTNVTRRLAFRRRDVASILA